MKENELEHAQYVLAKKIELALSKVFAEDFSQDLTLFVRSGKVKTIQFQGIVQVLK